MDTHPAPSWEQWTKPPVSLAPCNNHRDAANSQGTCRWQWYTHHSDQSLYGQKHYCWTTTVQQRQVIGLVIFLVGEIHICFNFLKIIGQHMYRAGLDDLWAEAGVYSANTTQTMLDGKAYYCAVIEHQLTYKSLLHLKWPMFKSWLAQCGRWWVRPKCWSGVEEAQHCWP